MNKYKIKQIIIITLILIVIGGITLFYLNPKDNNGEVINNKIEIQNNIPTPTLNPIDMCYYYQSSKTSSGFYDISWIKMIITGDKVIGEFQNLPAESDSKVGKFEGTVGPLDQKIMGRIASLWWDSMAEGMQVKEELIIEFGDGSASAGFGEMIDRGDGVYVYKDKTNLFYSKSMSQIDCASLDQKILKK